jgi:hypothetical protein
VLLIEKSKNKFDITFPILGGKMVPRYVLQFLFGEKSKIANKSSNTKAGGKISTDLESI